MSRGFLRTLALAASATMALPLSAAADTAGLRPLDLRVSNGAGWQAENHFALTWDRQHGASPPTTIHYRVRKWNEETWAETEVPWIADGVSQVRVPAGPGRYALELWLENDAGAGPRASAELRFDDTPPGAPDAQGAAPWFGGDAPVRLRIGLPRAPAPPSGIRGYEVSVDRDAKGFPCERPGRCSAEEIDLPAGAETAALSLGYLPEGRHVARVVAVSGAGVASAVRSAELQVDASLPTVLLAGTPSGWANGPVRLNAVATDSLSGMAADGTGGPFTAIAVDGGAPTASPGPSVSTTVLGEGVHTVAFFARDAAGNIGDGQAGSRAPAAAAVRIDATPPRVAFIVGRDPAEPERIEATVADSLSGPSATHGSIAFRAADSRRPFEAIPTALHGGRLVAHWDSEAQPPGGYEFRATGYDAAGNQASSVREADGTRMLLRNPLKRPAAIGLGFGARGAAVQLGRYGRGVLVRGRLSSATAPLAGRPVELVETFAAGAEVGARRTVLATGADGAFIARLPPGPTRWVEARFAGSETVAHASARRLRLPVRSAVRLRASSGNATIGGAPVVFTGRVAHLGATVPAEGLTVELQFRLGATPWSAFRTVQTDHDGLFRYPYAFSDDDSRGVRFQFRAHVPAQASWPYAPGASRPVLVTGH